MHWPAGWEALADGTRDEFFVREFRREAPPDHVLSGMSLRAVGAANDADNVLFELLDGSGRYAAVHLTYSVETDPRWPDTKIFEDWNQFEREGEHF